MASMASSPRALPLTIVGLSALLIFKSVTLVHAASAALNTSDPKIAADASASHASAAPNSSADPAQAERPAAPLLPSAPAQTAMIGASSSDLANELARQQGALTAREHDADAQAGVLAAARAKLATELSDLESRRKALESAETSKAALDTGNWDDLAKMYEDMAPKSAANIFNVIDVHVLLHILERMNVRKASAVLAAMDPERAKLATQMLALRKTSPRPADLAQATTASEPGTHAASEAKPQ